MSGTSTTSSGAARRRLRLEIEGAVQGVGFRPYVYRLASELNLMGWVRNSGQGVEIDIEGPPAQVEQFTSHLAAGLPPVAVIDELRSRPLSPNGSKDFTVVESKAASGATAMVLPDMATCPECLEEIRDPKNRRYRYPFTNCTNCGPRYSIVTSLPYDRPNTTMKQFAMCDRCRSEYGNPAHRRFHAQPNCCPDCGPQLALWDATGKVTAEKDKALKLAEQALKAGQILALKGLGGFQLLVDAADADAVRRLRQRKGRDFKPFAVMFPTLEQIENNCRLAPVERELLSSHVAPIVIVPRREEAALPARPLATELAPGNPNLGVMLPCTPLHHLLMDDLGFPVVATSGNLSEEPICTDERDALQRLGGIADLFLVHDRPIARHVDDSVVRVVTGRELVLRNARGYAPVTIRMNKSIPDTLAVGGHLKNSVAIARGNRVFVSQHIGDLETRQAYQAMKATISSLSSIYNFRPERVACDLHPDYLSSIYAAELGLNAVTVQHHYAHVLACMAENDLDGPLLGIAWDGTGLGLDGTIWGGEFLVADRNSFERAAHFRAFRLPGGEAAIKQPRRAALGILYELEGNAAFDQLELMHHGLFGMEETVILKHALRSRVNCPVTSSVGRLFDGVASLLGLCQVNHFEGQAAMALEFEAEKVDTDTTYPYRLYQCAQSLIVDWEPIACAILEDIRKGQAPAPVAAAFHNTLAALAVAVAEQIGQKQVVLTGGCFQNKLLAEKSIAALLAAGFEPFWHRRVPPNDGGIALGQIITCGSGESE